MHNFRLSALGVQRDMLDAQRSMLRASCDMLSALCLNARRCMLEAGCDLLNAACLLLHAVCDMLDADGFLLDAICWRPRFYEVGARFETLMAVMSKNTLSPSQRGAAAQQQVIAQAAP